jgi:hypothetical protein
MATHLFYLLYCVLEQAGCILKCETSLVEFGFIKAIVKDRVLCSTDVYKTLSTLRPPMSVSKAFWEKKG